MSCTLHAVWRQQRIEVAEFRGRLVDGQRYDAPPNGRRKDLPVPLGLDPHSPPDLHGCGNSPCSQGRVIVLPEPQYAPTIHLQGFVYPLVSSAIACKLRRPVRAVSLRLGAMHFTAMPETSIEKHRYPHARKHHIRPHTNPGCDDPPIYEVPQAERVKRASQQEFRRGIDPYVRTHGSPDRIATCLGRYWQGRNLDVLAALGASPAGRRGTRLFPGGLRDGPGPADTVHAGSLPLLHPAIL